MELRRRGLGRGIGALIPMTEEEPEDRAGGEGILLAPLESIRPNPYQPRESFAEESLAELAASIREKGLLQPLLVRRVDDGFELIAGERRYRAALRAGLDRVPVIARDADDRESLELALIENLQRENLNPIEEARAYRRLIDEFGLRQEDVATRVGKNRSTVTNGLRLLQLPAEIQRQIEAGSLSAGHARSLLALASVEEQTEAVAHIVGTGLSVRDTEILVRKRVSSTPDADPDRRALEDDLSRLLGTRVRLRPGRNGRGRIEIEYYSNAELTGLVQRLNRAQHEMPEMPAAF